MYAIKHEYIKYKYEMSKVTYVLRHLISEIYFYANFSFLWTFVSNKNFHKYINKFSQEKLENLEIQKIMELCV